MWTFKLREGVKFHDGSDFDAADVVYTYRRLLDESVGSPGRALLSFLDPEGIEALDAHTVRFTTKDSVAQLATLIRNRFTNIVSEGATTEAMQIHGVGTGPFTIENLDKGAPFWQVNRNPRLLAAGAAQGRVHSLHFHSGADNAGRRTHLGGCRYRHFNRSPARNPARQERGGRSHPDLRWRSR